MLVWYLLGSAKMMMLHGYMVLCWKHQNTRYTISVCWFDVWYILGSAKMMMPHIFYIYRYTEMFCQYLLSTYLHRIIFFFYCFCFVVRLNIWPDSLDAGGSAGVDDEAPAEVLLDGVQPPELARHDDEDGRHVDQHQPLHTLLHWGQEDRRTGTLTRTNTSPTLVLSSKP